MNIKASNCHRSLDSRLRLVIQQLNIVEGKVEDGSLFRVELEGRQRTWRAGELAINLFEMIGINVGVAESMDEIAYLQSTVVSNQVRQQSVGGDVEGNAQKAIRTTLVQLATQLAVRHVKLKNRYGRVAVRPSPFREYPPDSRP